jgi:DNA-binding beta-propeller fold protein YncE
LTGRPDLLRIRGIALSAATLLALQAAAPHEPRLPMATGQIAASAWPYLPGSIVPLRVNGFSPPYRAVVLGPGRVSQDGTYEISANAPPGTALLVAGNAAGLAAKTLRIARPPSTRRTLLMVASYDDGIVFHDGDDFSVLGVLATGGAPSDVAVDAGGKVAAADTEGTALTLATLAPWSVARIDGVVLGDEIEIDRSTGDVFVTDRDWQGSGALTRVVPDGSIARVATGSTAEGLAIDERRHIVYVANANDASVSAVDTRSMRILRRFPAVTRVFSLALSPDGTLLYAISNQSAGSPFDAPGSAVALALSTPVPRVVARSGNLDFPLGIALDSATQTLFVTDEALGEVDVLDATTLRAKRAPLRTCTIPWKPLLDAETQRLYVPCAGANAVDVFDALTLRRVRGAPFATGSYPLSVGIWHPT